MRVAEITRAVALGTVVGLCAIGAARSETAPATSGSEGRVDMASKQTVTAEDVRRELESPEIAGLYKRTYESIVNRVEPDGYFQESLTGAYIGMFPRTVGGLVTLFAETGEWDKARRTVDIVLKAAKANGMTRSPHVMDRKQVENAPVAGSEPLVSTDHSVALYKLNQGYRGAQSFTAPADPVKAIDAWVSASRKGDGGLRLWISERLDDEAGIASANVARKSASEYGRWASFKFASPVRLLAGRRYYIQIAATDDGDAVWFGSSNPESPLAGGYGHNPKPSAWISNGDHVTAFAVDTGSLKRKKVSGYPIISRSDQLDGNFHVLAGWARVVLNSDAKKWEDQTYAQVASLADTAVDWPYLPPQAKRIWPGLIHNFCLEHSREGRYWDTWDILTQSWACEGLRLLTRVAERRGDQEHADRWRRAYTNIENAVRENLTMELDGKLVYAEMRLPNGGDGVLFDGISWLNLSPVQAQWEGADPKILHDTIYTLRDKTRLVWDGHVCYGDEWDPRNGTAHQVIGKGVGWDIVYATQEKDWKTIVDWLEFIKAANKPQLYAEAFNIIDGKMVLQDAGNGEQVSWWCWGIARARKAVGLPAAP